MVATFTVVTTIEPAEEVKTMEMCQRLCRLKGDHDGARRWRIAIAAYKERHGLTD